MWVHVLTFDLSIHLFQAQSHSALCESEIPKSYGQSLNTGYSGELLTATECPTTSCSDVVNDYLLDYLSRNTGSSGFTTRSDTNGPVQLQKMARSLKFWI